MPTGASADTAPAGSTKAGIERAERVAAGGTGLSKAQIEQNERVSVSGGSSPALRSPVGTPASSDNSAAAWQLAFSAALGAALTGGVVLATRQVNHHRHAIAA